MDLQHHVQFHIHISIGAITSSSGIITISGPITLGANILGGAGVNLGNVILNSSPIIIDGGSGNVNIGTIDGTVGTEDLTITASNTVSFGAIGMTTDIGDLLVNANTINVNGNVETADSITLTGNVNLGGDLIADTGNIIINGDITLIGDRNLKATGIGADIDIRGDISRDISGDWGLTLNANQGIVTLGTVGRGAHPKSLIINSQEARLNGDINVDGSVDLSGVGTTTIGADLTIDITGGADRDSVNIGIIRGAHNLTIIADDSDVILGAISELTGLRVVSANEIELNGNINIPGDIKLIAGDNDGANNDNITIAANVNITSTAGDILLQAGDDIIQRPGIGIISAGGGDITLIAGHDNDGVGLISIEGKVGSGAENLTLEADQTITAKTNVSTLTAKTNDANITILEDNGLALNLVDAGRGDVNITLAAGAITDNNGSQKNIIGNNVVLSAISGIGSGDALETTITTLTATNTNNGIEILDEGGLTILGVTNTNGWVNITTKLSPLNINANVTAGGDINLIAEDNNGANNDNITIAANVNITSTAGDILLQAGDNITQATGTGVISAGGGDITLIAGHDNDGVGLISILGKVGSGAENLTLEADQTITAKTNVSTLTAKTNDAKITIWEDNGLALNLVDAGTGNVWIRANNGAITDNNGSSLNIKGTDLVLWAETGIGSGDALETEVTRLAAQVTSGTATGNIEIENTGDLTLSNLNTWGYAIKNFGSGDVKITATGRIFQDHPASDIITSGGNFIAKATGSYTMVDGASVSTGSGYIDIDAGGDITIGQLIGSFIYLNSGGAIIDGGDSEGADIIGYGLEMRAQNGIGTAIDSIDTQVSYLAAVTTNGQIYINQTGNLTIAQVRNTNGVTVTNGGAIEINTNGSSLTLNANQDINSNGGNITILAGGVTQKNGADILSSGGNINIGIDEHNNIIRISTLTQESDSKIDAGLGNVNIYATGNIALDEIRGNIVRIDTTGGSIIEQTSDADYDLIATNLILNAKNGIGTKVDPIETNVDTLTASTSNADIVVTEANGLNLNNVNAGTGDVIITLTTGALTSSDQGAKITADEVTLTAPDGINVNTNINTLTATSTNGDIRVIEDNGLGLNLVEARSGGVWIIVRAGDLTDNNGDALNIKARDTSGLYAGGTIGIDEGSAEWVNPIEVEILGDLYVYGGEMYRFVSVAIDGEVVPKDMLLVEDDWGVPPGLIIFNGRVNDGGESPRWFRANGFSIHYIGIEPSVYDALMLNIIDPTYFEPSPSYWNIEEYIKQLEESLALK